MATDNNEMLDTLNRIAAIAHSGGLVDMSEFDALCIIRRLTLKYWNIHETTSDKRLAVENAVINLPLDKRKVICHTSFAVRKQL